MIAFSTFLGAVVGLREVRPLNSGFCLIETCVDSARSDIATKAETEKDISTV